MCICICKYTYMYTYIYVYIYMNVYTYICIRIQKYVYVYHIYIYISRNTHIRRKTYVGVCTHVRAFAAQKHAHDIPKTNKKRNLLLTWK